MQGQAAVRVFARLDAAGKGNFGDCRPVGEGVFEMRIDVGPGYRIYESFHIYIAKDPRRAASNKDFRFVMAKINGLPKTSIKSASLWQLNYI